MTAPPIATPTAFELEILRGQLQSVVDEAGATLMKTAFSPMVREAKDFACAILTPEGRSVVQPVQSIPVFLGTVSHSARAILEQVPFGELVPGDVVATNDPWLGTGHLFDLVALRPIFFRGEVVARAAVIAHLPDIGGGVAFGLGASTVFEEGLRIPPMRLATAAGVDKTLLQILGANVRVPDQVIGDVEAVLNAAAVIDRQVVALCEDHSPELFTETCNELESRSADVMRRALECLPDGTAQASLEAEGVAGRSFTLQVRLTKRGGEIEVDFAGTTEQLPVAVNSVFSYTQAYAVYALKCVLAPELPFNEGLTAPITVHAPEGTIVNSVFPAAGASRNLVGHFIPGVILDALEQLAPGTTIAECGAPRPIVTISGGDGDGAPFTSTLLVVGGFGARPTKDGPSCMVFPTNTRTLPVEIVEATAPVLIEHKELVEDSGGAGAYRGGLGQELRLRCLAAEAEASVAVQGLKRAPQGRAGGGPGVAAAVAVNGVPLRELGERIHLRRGDVLTVRSPGGGGYGRPAARSPDAVHADVLGGYVSPDAAERIYGTAAADQHPGGDS